MANAEDLRNVWNESVFSPPNCIFAIVTTPGGQYKRTFLVISDDNNIFSFMDEFGEVYYVNGERCQMRNGNYYYRGNLYYSNCSVDEDRTNFVREQLVPIFYDIGTIW